LLLYLTYIDVINYFLYLVQAVVSVWGVPVSGSDDNNKLVLRNLRTIPCSFHLQIHRIQRVGFTLFTLLQSKYCCIHVALHSAASNWRQTNG